MTLEEALKALKENGVAMNDLIKSLEYRVGNVEITIECYRREIQEWEQKIEEEKIKGKEDKIILEALKAIVNN